MREQRLLGMSLTHDEPDEELSYDKIDDTNLVAHIEKEIEEYKEPQKAILHFLFVKGYKPREVAQVIPNTNNRGIAVLAHRFRKQMWDKYEEVL